MVRRMTNFVQKILILTMPYVYKDGLRNVTIRNYHIFENICPCKLVYKWYFRTGAGQPFRRYMYLMK